MNYDRTDMHRAEVDELGEEIEQLNTELAALRERVEGLESVIREAVRMQGKEHPDYILAGLRDALADHPKGATP